MVTPSSRHLVTPQEDCAGPVPVGTTELGPSCVLLEGGRKGGHACVVNGQRGPLLHVSLKPGASLLPVSRTTALMRRPPSRPPWPCLSQRTEGKRSHRLHLGSGMSPLKGQAWAPVSHLAPAREHAPPDQEEPAPAQEGSRGQASGPEDGPAAEAARAGPPGPTGVAGFFGASGRAGGLLGQGWPLGPGAATVSSKP